MKVLIGFADALAAIECAWSLLESGFEVEAVAREGSRPALRRLSPVRVHTITAPERDVAAARSELAALAERLGADAVMPLDDVSVRLCQGVFASGGPVLVGPDGPRAEVALGKRLQLRAAEAAGFSVPDTCFLGPGGSGEELRFPLVVRPAAAATEREGKLRSAAGARTCADRGELEAALAAGEEEGELLAQPQLRGTGEGIFGLATPDGVRAWSAHRRVRMANPAGSGSSACESIPLDEALRERAERLVESLGWSGMFMIELLRDDAGRPWFIELNGRAWGSMALARAAGLEYPAWAAQLSLGALPAGLPAQGPPGPRRARHLGREVVHLLAVMHGPRSAAERWPSRSSTLHDVLSWRRGDRVYNWRRRPDEIPLLIEDTVSTVRAAVARRGARAA